MKGNGIFINFKLDIDILPVAEILLLKENPQTVEGEEVEFLFTEVTKPP